jgi:RNA polymerase sigma factor (sigma-70 family)
MTEADDSLRDLLDRLNRGEEDAARQVFEAYGPYLRMVVRRRLSAPLRTKLDSEDIVQSVWADLIHVFREGRGSFPDVGRLRAFLIRAACNRLIDRHRQYAKAIGHERPSPDGEFEHLASDDRNRPEAVVVADELWDRILASCPPSHHDLIRLKREGLGVAEIAERTGLHPSSVRRILYDLARRLGIARATDRTGQPTS